VAGPSITQREIDLVAEAAAQGWYGGANVYQERFEAAFAQYVGVRHAACLPSCTAAIHLALLALGVGPGDEVILPDITWIASAAPVSYVGATPVFADIDPHTWCLSVRALEECITPRTRAVIPVDLYGNMPDMNALRAVADRHGIAVIEDAAEAVGSEFHGRKAGGFGAAGVFSFHGSKTLTTGEGGMLVTDREDIYRRVLTLRDHGRAPGAKMFWNAEVAYKYKMSSVQAALGLAQLERIDALVALKREIFSWYKGALGGLSGVTLNSEAPGTKNTYWMVTAVLDASLGISKEQMIARLSAVGIDSRPFFYPLSMLPAYAQTRSAREAQARSHVSYRLAPWGVNLPSAMNLTRAQVQFVCESFKAALDARKSED